MGANTWQLSGREWRCLFRLAGSLIWQIIFLRAYTHYVVLRSALISLQNYKIPSRNNTNRFLLGEEQRQNEVSYVRDYDVRAAPGTVPVSAVLQRHSLGGTAHGEL